MKIKKKKKNNPDLSNDKVKFEKSGGKKNVGDDGLGSEENKDKNEEIFLRKTEDIVELKPEEINDLKAISDEKCTEEIVKRMIKGKKEPKLTKPESFLEINNEERAKLMIRRINNKEEKDPSIKELYILLNKFSKNLCQICFLVVHNDLFEIFSTMH